MYKKAFLVNQERGSWLMITQLSGQLLRDDLCKGRLATFSHFQVVSRTAVADMGQGGRVATFFMSPILCNIHVSWYYGEECHAENEAFIKIFPRVKMAVRQACYRKLHRWRIARNQPIKKTKQIWCGVLFIDDGHFWTKKNIEQELPYVTDARFNKTKTLTLFVPQSFQTKISVSGIKLPNPKNIRREKQDVTKTE